MAEGDVLKTIRAAAKGLLFPSESDKPVKAFRWKKEDGAEPSKPSEDAIGTEVRASKEATIKPVAIDDLFAPVIKEQPWFGEPEKERMTKFQNLITVLKDNLTDLQAFRIEEPDATTIPVYVVGQTKSGDLAGVQTELIET